MTTFRADGTAIRLPGLMKRLTWLIGFPELHAWITRSYRKYRFCTECGVAIPRERYESHATIHNEVNK